MDLEASPPLTSLVKCCDCGCSFSSLMNRSLSGTCLLSVKRKFDKYEDDGKFMSPDLVVPQVARIEIGNEVDVLRETVGNQQETIEDLCCDLEEERDASSSAANEAMSMILRLQREKAEAAMESRQFKRFAEEQMAHDQLEILALEDVLYKREHTIQSLTCDVQSYKHRMMSYGFTEAEFDNNSKLDEQLNFPVYDYPRLKCNLNEIHVYSEADNEGSHGVEKYAFGETPGSRDHLKGLEFRINQLEEIPKSIQPAGEFIGTENVLEKVIVGYSPRSSRHLRNVSTDSTATTPKETESPNFGSINKKEDSQLEEYSNKKKVDNASENGDDMKDKICTIDFIHQEAPYNNVAETKTSIGFFDDCMTTSKESLNHTDFGDVEIKKMYTRLQVLEADKESMRQAFLSMRTDKAQLSVLKEIAQHLCKEMPNPRSAIAVKPSSFVVFSFLSVCKFVMSLIFWKNKANRCRYMFGMSPHSTGLLLILNKGSHVGQWRCFSRTQM